VVDAGAVGSAAGNLPLRVTWHAGQVSRQQPVCLSQPVMPVWPTAPAEQ
jgi:hypothetical protein